MSNSAALTPELIFDRRTIMSAHDVTPAVCLRTMETLFVDDDEWCLYTHQLLGIIALTSLIHRDQDSQSHPTPSLSRHTDADVWQQ